MLTLELRHLRMLCTIADTGSLTKAATQLGLTQPSLTGQLQRIEQACGGRLFERTRAGVVPTALGHRVIGVSRGVLAGVDYIQGFINERDPGDDATVVPPRVGSVQTRMTGAWTQSLRDEFGTVAPLAEVGLLPSVLLDMVSTGQLDACIVFECDGAPLKWPDTVHHRTLQEVEPAFVALPATHPLTARDGLRLVDLADEEWVTFPPNETGELNVFLSCCAEAGFTPRIISQTTDVTTMFDLVTRGAVLVCQADSREGPGYTVRPLGEPRMNTRRLLAWRHGLPEATVHRLWDCTVRALRTQFDNNPSYARWSRAHPEAYI